MTNFEKLRQMSIREMRSFLCDLFEDCSKCPMEKACYKNHAGWEKWLLSENFEIEKESEE